MSADLDKVSGQHFGKYTLIDRIAVGGMAEIFLAMQSGVEGFEKLIAVKRMRPQLSGDENFVRMFLNEAKLAAQLAHPNIVQIYDLGRINESYFIAMEYLPGRDMSRVIPKCSALERPFPIEYALKIASATLEGLYYAHNKTDNAGRPLGIVHRDITPENILVGYSGAVKIADFGIAKAATYLEARAGEIKGKLSYMSPEQCMGKDLDHRSDIFSLGVVLYEWLTGFKLFSGTDELAVMNNIIEGKIHPPSYFREEIGEAVEKILMKALEKDRKRRYQSAWDMQFDIDTFLASNEFTPSSVHLSNFMKQLFKEEREREQAFLARGMTAMPEDAETIVLRDEVGDAAQGAHANRGAEAPALSVALTPAELEALKKLGNAKKQTPEQTAQEILRAVLRVLG